MTALKIIGSTIAGGGVGLVVGFFVGERQGGDFNIAPAFTAPIGAVIGGFIGVVVGAVAFT